MTTITIELTEKAVEIMQKTAEIRKMSLQQFATDYFKMYEHYAQTPEEKLQGYYAEQIKRQKIKEATEYYAKYRWHRYILKRFDDGKVIEIGWRSCPIIEHPEEYNLKKKENIGKYYLQMQEVNRKSWISMVTKTEYEFYPTLKRLKKAINRWFEKYGYGVYYKQKQKNITK